MYEISNDISHGVHPDAGDGSALSRLFWWVVLRVFLVVWGWVAGSGLAWADTGPQVTAQRITDSVYFVQGVSALGSADNRNFISNAAFVITPRGVVVIDALGSPPLAEELLVVIKGLTPQPVTQVIVTHYHADHIYGLQTFRKAGARILAHRRAQEYLGSDLARQRLTASREDLGPWIDENTQLLPADEWLDEKRDLEVGGVVFQLRHVGPAHTPEDTVVYLPSQKVLFAGDLVFRGRIPFVGQADSGRWISALDSLLGFETRWILPGHGPVSSSAREDLSLTRDYLSFLREAMGDAARKLEPFEDAYQRTNWSRFEKIPLFGVANRINAYNTYLLLERDP